MTIYITSETTSRTKQSSSHKKYDTFMSGQSFGSFKRWDGGEEVGHTLLTAGESSGSQAGEDTCIFLSDD